MPESEHQTIESKVLSRIYGHKRGWVFSPADFVDLGNRAAIGMALKKATDRGALNRLSRGLYHYPRLHPKLGPLAPSPEKIAQALAGRDNVRLQPSGAYAANLLGLTEQVPAKVIFLTDGPNRRVQIGKQEIILQKTSPRLAATSGRTSGLVIQALRHFGRDHVDGAMIDKLASRLSPEQRRDLLKDIRYAPAWIGDIMRQLATRDN